MKKKQFRELLKSIDQARAIHRGKRWPSRVFRRSAKSGAIRKKSK